MTATTAPTTTPNPAPTRVGLLGGTFDPIHNTHLALAQAALQHLRLQQLRWVPAGTPWQKTRTITPAQHRLAMVQAATAGDARYVVDDIETRRSGASYTVDTVQALTAAHPGTAWVFIMGQDQFNKLHTWHRWQDLVAMVSLAVAQRPGQALTPPPELAKTAFEQLPFLPTPVSSTNIRQRVAQGQDITHLVPSTVARYIETHGLYRSPTGS